MDSYHKKTGTERIKMESVYFGGGGANCVSRNQEAVVSITYQGEEPVDMSVLHDKAFRPLRRVQNIFRSKSRVEEVGIHTDLLRCCS